MSSDSTSVPSCNNGQEDSLLLLLQTVSLGFESICATSLAGLVLCPLRIVLPTWTITLAATGFVGRLYFGRGIIRSGKLSTIECYFPLVGGFITEQRNKDINNNSKA